MNHVTTFMSCEVPLGLRQQIAELDLLTWPREVATDPEDYARACLKEVQAYSGPTGKAPVSCLVIKDGRLLAMAHTFAREIGTTDGRKTIMALAGVAVHEQWRGAGLGRAVVQSAFERVDQGLFPFSLFQTSSQNRSFYNKLGVSFIDNKVVNSLAPDGPETPAFWEDTIVLYPPEPGWPEGEVDLRGPGY
jgi:GNAT superfamily N-acetyltransferase